jgi:tetratricopeptide (TPR) repeat protein
VHLLIAAFGIAMKLQRDVAVEARTSAEAAEKRSLINEQQAQAEAARARQVQDLLVDVFQLVDPHHPQWTHDIAGARELLDRGAKRVLERSDVPPLVQAGVMQAIAKSYVGLGVREPAHRLLDRALAIRRELQGPDHEQVAVCLIDLAVLAASESDWKKGESLAQEALNILRSQPQVDRFAVSEALSLLATIVFGEDDKAKAESLAREAISLRPSSGPGEKAFRRPLLFLLSQLVWARGDPAEAEKLAWEALHLAPQPLTSPDVSDDFEHLSRIYGSLGKREAQETAARCSLELALRTLGPEHPLIGAKVSMLITALADQGRTQEAVALCRQLVDRQRKSLGDSRSETAESLFLLGTLLANSGDFAAAVEPFREAARIHEHSVGENHIYTLDARSSLASALFQAGKGPEGEAMARDVLERYRTHLPENRFRISMSEAALGWMLKNKGDLPGARTHLEAAVKGLRDLGNDPRELGRKLYLLAIVVSDQGDEEASEALYRESFALLQKNQVVDAVITMRNLAERLEDHGDDRHAERRYREALDLLSEAEPKPPLHRKVMAQLGLVLARNGKDDAAEPLLRQVLQTPTTNPASDLDRARALTGLGLTLIDTERADEARPLLEESLAIQTTQHADPRLINETKSILGRCRSELEDFEVAEQLLLESANAMKSALGAADKRTQRAFAALVRCYEASGENEKADEYRSAAGLTEGAGSH